MTSATATSTEPRGPFTSMWDLERKHQGHWFDADTIRWFKTTFPDGRYHLYHGRYFISGERYSGDTARLYTIRYADDEGNIHTLGEFQDYRTPATARKALKKHLGRE